MSNGSVRMFYGWFTVLGLVVGGLVVLGYYKDEYREWKDYQRKFIKEEIRRASTPQQKMMAEHIPVEVRQILLPELGRVDRCTTCHLAVEDPSYAFALSRLSGQDLEHTVMGVFRQVQRPTYDDGAREQVRAGFEARLAGFKLLFVPDAKMWHKVSATSGGEFSAFKIKNKIKSNLRFFIRYARPVHWHTIPWFVLGRGIMFARKKLIG